MTAARQVAVPLRITITAGGAPAATEPTAELGGNGVIKIGPADVAGQRSMQETTAPVMAGVAPIPTTGAPTINHALHAHNQNLAVDFPRRGFPFSR